MAEAREHRPRYCPCGAPILWAQVLSADGKRIRNEDTGRFRAMPVDWEPRADGNVIVYWREGEGFVCRVLRGGERARPGENARTSHFATCPNASQHRGSRRA